MSRVVKALLLVVLGVVLYPQTAVAAPQQSSRAEVLGALGVAPQPSDYVVLVDTSGSMKGDRYEGVRSAIRSLVAALNPDDHLSLVTFDSAAQVRFRGPVGGGAAKVLAALPAAPTGARTDIGSGIEAGLMELIQPGARGTAAVVLITDGEVDAPNSPYADPQSAAWTELRTRAQSLTANRKIAAWAVSLVDTTDAGLLKTVFPEALVVSGDQLQARLGALNEDLLNFLARDRLKADAGGQVLASWGPDDWRPLAPEEGVREATLTLQSTFTLVPVQVEQPFVESTGDLRVLVEGLPESVVLQPGESVSLPVKVSHPAAPGQRGTLRETGDVTSPWQEVMTGQLGLTFDPPLAAQDQSISAAQEPFRLPTETLVALLAGGGLGALVVALAILAYLRRPKLAGSLEVHRDGAVVREFLLDGRHVSLKTAAGGSVPGLRGDVSATRSRKGEPPEVRLSGRLNGHRFRTLLGDRQSLDVDGWELSYTAPRTRSLAMINAMHTLENVASADPGASVY